VHHVGGDPDQIEYLLGMKYMFLATLSLASNDLLPNITHYIYELDRSSLDWIIVDPAQGQFEVLSEKSSFGASRRFRALFCLMPTRVGLTTLPTIRVYMKTSDSSQEPMSLIPCHVELWSSMKVIEVIASAGSH
jgi:hypothetical protein